MKTLSRLLLVSLCVGVAAPAAARPRRSVVWPGVNDVLLNLNVAAPAAALPRNPISPWVTFTDARLASMLKPSNMWCSDQSLQRLIAEWGYFDDDLPGTFDEVNTPHEAPGVPVYERANVEVPDGCDTLYITIAAVGEIAPPFTSEPGDAEMQLGCFVDFDPCHTDPEVDTDEDDPGFVGVFSDVVGPADFSEEDYGATIPVNYTWCLPITPGSHVVQIKLASGDEGTDVSLSHMWVYIDASNTNGGCTRFKEKPDPAGGILPPLPKLP